MITQQHIVQINRFEMKVVRNDFQRIFGEITPDDYWKQLWYYFEQCSRSVVSFFYRLDSECQQALLDEINKT